MPSLLAVLSLLPLSTPIHAPAALVSDHGDTLLLDAIARPDAKITDLHAFVRGDRLVLSVCMNPAIAPGVTSYVWPSDVTVDINVDNGAQIGFADATDLDTYGGTLEKPEDIGARIVFRIQVDSDGDPRVTVLGKYAKLLQGDLEFFAGLRDDPFIRGPRIGRNVAALVLSVELRRVVKGNRPLVLWATSSIEGRTEPFQDLAGRSLRSMFVENGFMNTEHPRDHWLLHGVVPDVMIFDTDSPASFPNGRELADDVVDLVGHAGTLANDSPFPSTNDVPFLTAFPYLAPPQ